MGGISLLCRRTHTHAAGRRAYIFRETIALRHRLLDRLKVFADICRRGTSNIIVAFVLKKVNRLLLCKCIPTIMALYPVHTWPDEYPYPHIPDRIVSRRRRRRVLVFPARSRYMVYTHTFSGTFVYIYIFPAGRIPRRSRTLYHLPTYLLFAAQGRT